MGKYDKIIALPHHQSKNHTPMALRDRAAQFAPFAALTGYDDLVVEAARFTNEKIEFGESQLEVLNRKQTFLALHISDDPFVEITYFIADKKKSGGKYVTKQGVIKRIDEYNKSYIFTDGTIIPISDVIQIESEIFPTDI